MSDIKDRIMSLEERIRELEAQVELSLFQLKLVREFLNYDEHPFTYTVIEQNVTETQMHALFDLMEEVWQGLQQGNPMGRVDFEMKVYEICPQHRGNYHFAESIVSTLQDRSKYRQVYNYMKKEGMNI